MAARSIWLILVWESRPWRFSHAYTDEDRVLELPHCRTFPVTDFRHIG